MTFDDWLKRRRVESLILFLLSITVPIRYDEDTTFTPEEKTSIKIDITEQILFQLTDIHFRVFPIVSRSEIRLGSDIPEHVKSMTYREMCLLLEKIEERLPDIPEEFFVK